MAITLCSCFHITEDVLRITSFRLVGRAILNEAAGMGNRSPAFFRELIR